jgi:hypothetical protein
MLDYFLKPHYNRLFPSNKALLDKKYSIRILVCWCCYTKTLTTVIKLTILLFLFTNCQEKGEKKEVIKSTIKDTIFNSFQDKLAHLNISYKYQNVGKYYQQIILDPEDRDFAKLGLCRKNLRIPNKSAITLNLDSSHNYRGYFLDRLDNGEYLFGFSYNLDVGTYIDFIMYDSQGKLIKPVFKLASVSDIGFFHTNYAVIKNDTINLYSIYNNPIFYQNSSKTNFEYVNYIIHFDKNGNVLSDTLSKIKLDTTVSDIEKNKLKAKFYATKKAYKQQILDEEFKDKN